MADLAVFDAASLCAAVPRASERALPLPTWAGLSDAGRSRAHNEDSWCVLADCGLVLLADGMGGYNAGEVASALAVEAAANHVAIDDPAADRLAQLSAAFGAANASILAAAARRPECLGMGTTLVAARIDGTRLWHAHVGDSRLYRWRDGRLQCLTRDHSVGQAMIDAGVVPQSSPRGSTLCGVLTRALGVEPVVDVDLGAADLATGDRVMLCSDGLTDCVPDAQIERLLGADAPAAALSRSLVDAALHAGGHDNVTVVVVTLDRAPAADD